MEDKLIHVPPEEILADDNIRFAITAADVDVLKASILEQGEVLQPVEVEPVSGPNGFKYRLVSGFKRYRAVSELNQGGSGLKIPAIVRKLDNDLTRLRHQVSENVDRKSLTPMDVAVTIKKLLGAGLSQAEVCQLFKVARPGQKKTTIVKAASPAWLRMHLSFLTFPKAIQTLIHEGVIGTAAAYELSRAPQEKWEKIVERAKEDREKALEREEKDEQRYLEQLQKADAAQKEAEEQAVKAEEARIERELTAKALEAAEEERVAAFNAVKAAEKLKGEEKKAKLKAAKERLSGTEADAKGFQKKLDALTHTQESAEANQKKAEEKAIELKAKLDAETVTAKKKNALTKEDIREAAGKETGAPSVSPLTLAQIRKLVEDMSLSSKYPKVAEVGSALKACFAGEIKEGTMFKRIAAVVGELKEAPKAKKA